MGNGFSRFCHQYPLSLNISFGHQQPKDVTNIEIRSPTLKTCQQDRVTDIHLSSISLWPITWLKWTWSVTLQHLCKSRHFYIQHFSDILWLEAKINSFCKVIIFLNPLIIHLNPIAVQLVTDLFWIFAVNQNKYEVYFWTFQWRGSQTATHFKFFLRRDSFYVLRLFCNVFDEIF